MKYKILRIEKYQDKLHDISEIASGFDSPELAEEYLKGDYDRFAYIEFIIVPYVFLTK